MLEAYYWYNDRMLDAYWYIICTHRLPLQLTRSLISLRLCWHLPLLGPSPHPWELKGPMNKPRMHQEEQVGACVGVGVGGR